MKIKATKTVEIEARTISLHMKVRDSFRCQLLDQDGDVLKDYEGYVPSIMPPAKGEDSHFGDYLCLDIDVDTGRITNWRPLTAKDVEAFLAREQLTETTT